VKDNIIVLIFFFSSCTWYIIIVLDIQILATASFPFYCIICCIVYEILNYLKNYNFCYQWSFGCNNKVQFNPLKPTRDTRNPYDPKLEQTEDVHGWNWVQIKRLRFLSVSIPWAHDSDDCKRTTNTEEQEHEGTRSNMKDQWLRFRKSIWHGDVGRSEKKVGVAIKKV
jgi:hypothetical protein